MAVGLYGGEMGQQDWINNNFNMSGASQYTPGGGGYSRYANTPQSPDGGGNNNLFMQLSPEQKALLSQLGQGLPGGMNPEQSGYQPARNNFDIDRVKSGFDFGKNTLRPAASMAIRGGAGMAKKGIGAVGSGLGGLFSGLGGMLGFGG